MENAVLTAIKERRSIRKYKKEPIREEQLQAILEAAAYAPTGQGMQSPVMVAVTDPETVRELSRLNARVLGTDNDPFYGAPAVVVVLADSERGTCVEDGSLVMGTLMLAAHSVGVDSCWIHRAREVFESPEGKELLKKWGLSEKYIGIGNCILGYRDCEYPKAKERKKDYILYV